jgi:hypothetical protein
MAGMNQKSQICKQDVRAGEMLPTQSLSCSTGQRLAHAFARLQTIHLVRDHQHDPLFEKAVESRIIWRELLEMELQDVDERIEQIRAAAGNRYQR